MTPGRIARRPGRFGWCCPSCGALGDEPTPAEAVAAGLDHYARHHLEVPA